MFSLNCDKDLILELIRDPCDVLTNNISISRVLYPIFSKNVFLNTNSLIMNIFNPKYPRA